YNTLVSVNYKFSNKFNINADMSYSLSNRDNFWTGKIQTPRGMAMTKMPNMSPYFIDESGNYTDEYFTPRLNFQGSYSGEGKGSTCNPPAMVNDSVNKTAGEQARVIFRAHYQVLPELQYARTEGLDTRVTKNTKY